MPFRWVNAYATPAAHPTNAANTEIVFGWKPLKIVATGVISR